MKIELELSDELSEELKRISKDEKITITELIIDILEQNVLEYD